MAYNGLTNAGAAYLAARQANKLPVEFLKAKVGNGIVPSGTDPAELTDIISGKMEVEITDIHQVERALKMTVQISNESLTTGFYLTEIAIFVNDNGTPVLYWYIGKDNGTYVPDSTKPMKYKNILNIEVSNTPVTTVNYTGKDLWIDEETLNAKFGTKEKEILEGIQLVRTLGLEYGGELNNSNTKKLNTVYYDTQNKSFFKCFRENTLNYADSNYYEGISNNDLLLKLQNLANSVKTFASGNINLPITVEENWKFGFATIRFKDSRGTSTTIPITYTSENFSVFEQVDSSGTIYHDLVNIVGNRQLSVYSAIKEKGISNTLYISKAILFY
nr:MAG TPA: tail-collar fiber protein [Caudoviricetes sp.]